jgi:hypothetical protein
MDAGVTRLHWLERAKLEGTQLFCESREAAEMPPAPIGESLSPLCSPFANLPPLTAVRKTPGSAAIARNHASGRLRLRKL